VAALLVLKDRLNKTHPRTKGPARLALEAIE
jgi:hypothetical protein